MTIRERHDHVFKTPKGADEKCDAALLLAAGDAMVEATRLNHDAAYHAAMVPTCAICAARAHWRKVTDG